MVWAYGSVVLRCCLWWCIRGFVCDYYFVGCRFGVLLGGWDLLGCYVVVALLKVLMWVVAVDSCLGGYVALMVGLANC